MGVDANRLKVEVGVAVALVEATAADADAWRELGVLLAWHSCLMSSSSSSLLLRLIAHFGRLLTGGPCCRRLETGDSSKTWMPARGADARLFCEETGVRSVLMEMFSFGDSSRTSPPPPVTLDRSTGEKKERMSAFRFPWDIDDQ